MNRSQAEQKALEILADVMHVSEDEAADAMDQAAMFMRGQAVMARDRAAAEKDGD